MCAWAESGREAQAAPSGTRRGQTAGHTAPEQQPTPVSSPMDSPIPPLPSSQSFPRCSPPPTPRGRRLRRRGLGAEGRGWRAGPLAFFPHFLPPAAFPRWLSRGGRSQRDEGALSAGLGERPGRARPHPPSSGLWGWAAVPGGSFCFPSSFVSQLRRRGREGEPLQGPGTAPSTGGTRRDAAGRARPFPKLAHSGLNGSEEREAFPRFPLPPEKIVADLRHLVIREGE